MRGAPDRSDGIQPGTAAGNGGSFFDCEGKAGQSGSSDGRHTGKIRGTCFAERLLAGGRKKGKRWKKKENKEASEEE